MLVQYQKLYLHLRAVLLPTGYYIVCHSMSMEPLLVSLNALDFEFLVYKWCRAGDLFWLYLAAFRGCLVCGRQEMKRGWPDLSSLFLFDRQHAKTCNLPHITQLVDLRSQVMYCVLLIGILTGLCLVRLGLPCPVGRVKMNFLTMLL